MNEIESDCESVDSGLETGNSNLETSDNGFLEEEEADSASDGFDKPAVEGSYDLQNSEDRWDHVVIRPSAVSWETWEEYEKCGFVIFEENAS